MLMKVTLVEPQKRNPPAGRAGPRRFNIFLDGVFGFGADEDTIIKFRLIPGKEISQNELDNILQETEVGKLMARMYNLFNIRQRTEKEVRGYFKRLNFKNKISNKEEFGGLVLEKVIDNLKNKGMINDRVFAEAWVESRRRSKLKGKNVIKAELLQKGISREIIEEILSDESTQPESEMDLAKKALEKKARLLKNLPVQEFRKKATEFLTRKGFEYSVSKKVIDLFLEAN